MSRSGIDVELTSDKCLLDPVLRYVRSQGVLSLSMSEGGGGRVRESGGGMLIRFLQAAQLSDNTTDTCIHACNME